MQSKNTSYNCPSHSLIAYKQCWNNSPNTSARKIFCQVFQILIVPWYSTHFRGLVKFSEILIGTSVESAWWWPSCCQKLYFWTATTRTKPKPFEMCISLGHGAQLLFRQNSWKIHTLLSLQFEGENSSFLVWNLFFSSVNLWFEFFLICTLTENFAIRLQNFFDHCWISFLVLLLEKSSFSRPLVCKN